MQKNTLLKHTPFKQKPYSPGQQSGLAQNSSLQSNTRLRQHAPRLNTHKIQIGDKVMFVWSTNTADTEFSKWVRDRDGNRCMLCGSTEDLTNSHFHGRKNSMTRYLPENCDCFCWSCHKMMEYQKQKGQEYYNFKLTHLGVQKMIWLAATAQQSVARETAIIDCMKFLLITNKI
jgi:hypothetical protein